MAEVAIAALLLLLSCPASAFHIPYSSVHHRISLSLEGAASTAATLLSTSTWDGTRSSKPEQQQCSSPDADVLLDHVDQLITSNNNDAPSSFATLFDTSTILENINQAHERDVIWAEKSMLPFENEELVSTNNRCNSIIEYESIQDATAIRTKQHSPMLNADEIKLLQIAAEAYWNRPEDEDGASEKSRFTYQRKGNSEAHLSEVVAYAVDKSLQQQNDDDVASLVNELLLNRIYPWIREAFLSQEECQDAASDELELYVYDSLFIRYNATEANGDNNFHGLEEKTITQRKVGAGQPLHRDLGYVSVNIMLNSQEEFEGGGTFFENQLLPMFQVDGYSDYVAPNLKPLSPGGALAHYSSNRHAGAATFAGVRDILVLFLAATEKKKTAAAANTPRTAPRWEYNARIKSTARAYCSECCGNNNMHGQLVCRIIHHRLAIKQVPTDGEAWHYLGMALLDYHYFLLQGSESQDGGCKVLELAVSCLEEATGHTPCDGRLYNNLGIALERLLEYNSASNSIKINEMETQHIHERIASSYQKSVMIHATCEEIGCDVAADYESACLNYGLYLSKLDKFEDAINVLTRIATEASTNRISGEEEAEMWARQRVVRDATGLLSFCKRQIEK